MQILQAISKQQHKIDLSLLAQTDNKQKLLAQLKRLVNQSFKFQNMMSMLILLIEYDIDSEKTKKKYKIK